MFRFKKLFLLSANEAVNSVTKINSTSFFLKPILPGALGSQILANHGEQSRSFSKKITDLDRMGQLVDMQYLVASKHADETRSSNPIIILHGLLGSKENWHSMARQLNLRLGRKVFAVDFRNHGNSPHTYVFSYEFMVCDLIFFMRMYDMKRATLIGHSMGGRVAMMLAMRYPELVQSLIVVDISPVGASPNMIGITQLLKDIKNLQLDRHLTLKEARKQTAAQLREKKYDERIINFLLLNLVENEWHTNWRWKFNLDSIMENFEKEILVFPIVNSPCPTRTLFLGGGDSDYITPRHEVDIKELFPAAEFTYIQGAGHWVHSDKPVEFIDTVVSFLDKDPTKVQEDVEKHPLGRPIDIAFQKYDEHVNQTKSSVPVIILHGLLGSKQNWNSMAGLINKEVGRVVYTLDARNHGDSPHTEIFTYDLMMGDLLVFLRKNDISKATIIGHSMGGRVAMMMAMVYPVVVHSMVVVDMSPGGPSANMLGIRQLLKDLQNLKLDPELTVREARNQAAAQLRQTVKDERVIAFILTNLVEDTGRFRVNWRWKFNLDSIVKNFETEIADYPLSKRDVMTRSLFIGGADSDYIKPTDEVHIRKIFPQSEFVFVEDAGHWVHAEKPLEFLEIVSKFLDKDP